MSPLPLAAVLVLVAVLIGILGLVLILVGILILILIIHCLILRFSSLRNDRLPSLSEISGFILCLEQKACHKPGKNRSGNAAGSGP